MAISCLWRGGTIGKAGGQPEAAWLIAVSYRQSGDSEKSGTAGASQPLLFRSCRSALSNQTTCSRLEARGYEAPGWHLAFPPIRTPRAATSYGLSGLRLTARSSKRSTLAVPGADGDELPHPWVEAAL